MAELKRKQFKSTISDWPTAFIQNLALNSLHKDYIYICPLFVQLETRDVYGADALIKYELIC